MHPAIARRHCHDLIPRSEFLSNSKLPRPHGRSEPAAATHNPSAGRFQHAPRLAAGHPAIGRPLPEPTRVSLAGGGDLEDPADPVGA